MTSADRVTLVMITWNRREAAISAACRAARDHPHSPLIVVDNGSCDGTAAALRAATPGARVIEAGANLGSAGRTLGVLSADTPYVAFVDDDSGWRPGALDAAADLMDAWPDLAAIAARMLVQRAGEPPADDALNAVLAKSPLPPHRGSGLPVTLGFLACGAVVRSQAYLAAGGFHPRFGVGGEETLLAIDWAARDLSVVYAAAIRAVHEPDPAAPRPQRAIRQMRNDLWTSWLRRPASVAASATMRLARRAVRDPVSRRALWHAAAGIGWVARERRVLPRHVERQLRLLDAAA